MKALLTQSKFPNVADHSVFMYIKWLITYEV